MKAEGIRIYPCTTLENYDRCVELQRQVWGFADIELVSRDVLVVAVSTGGQLFGAFDGGRMVGFVMAFPAFRDPRPYLHSHMLAVLPEYRDKGVGRLLKLQQREDALARGLELVEWTFDPLELKNAYFNVMRLGAVMRRYVPNKYGRTTSPLHGGLPTDRLVAEWWLRLKRVEEAIEDRVSPARGGRERIEVPTEIAELKRKEPKAAERIQGEVREQFQKWFARRYVVTGFERRERAGVYVLEPGLPEIPR